MPFHLAIAFCSYALIQVGLEFIREGKWYRLIKILDDCECAYLELKSDIQKAKKELKRLLKEEKTVAESGNERPKLIYQCQRCG